MRVPVQLDTASCLAFARDTWSLEEARRINDTGRFMYLCDVTVLDGPIKTAPRLSAFEHLHPHLPQVADWWRERRRAYRIDDQLRNECRVFCDPLCAKDASEQDRSAALVSSSQHAPLGKSDESRPKRFKHASSDDPFEAAAMPKDTFVAHKKSAQVFLKGIAPSGAIVVWRLDNWRPFFFVQVEALGITEMHAQAMIAALEEECKTDSIAIDWVKAPRLIPFAYDPADPRRPKDLLWWRISFDTVRARQKAARFLSKREQWTMHPKLFRFPHEMRTKGLVLAEHVVDDVKMFLKTTQININSWLTIAHDAAVRASVAVNDHERATTAQFEWLVESASLLALYSTAHTSVVDCKARPALSSRFQSPYTLLYFDMLAWHAPTIGPSQVADELKACLASTNIVPPMVDATYDIEVSGNIRDESIFPEPQFQDYTAYLCATILSFKGTVPSVWRDRGVKQTNEPFAILVHSRCPWSPDMHLELEPHDIGHAAIYGVVQADESKLYELWSDWVFRVAQTDILSQFNGDHFDMPYILCRLTGNPMRPCDSFAKPMRASRFPWMNVIWSVPMKPYWKRLRARDKRSAGPVSGSGAPDDEDEGDDESVESEFEDEDNLDPDAIEETERAPDEPVTDQTQFDLILQVFGVATLDLMKFVKEIYKTLDEYSLSYLANLKLKNLSKLDVKPKQITEAWHHQDLALLDLVTSYCVRDVVVTLKLDESFKAFMTMNSLAFASTTPLSTLLVSGSQKRLLNCLVQFSSARGFVCNGIRDATYASTGSYEGGKVQDAVPGIHKTTCVDFASLYPSIMQCKNLCYCTFVPTWMVDKMSQADKDALILECFEPRPGIKYWFVYSFLGIVPAMLNYFVTRRRQVQRESKQAFELGNDSLGSILDLLQLAFKILANATYGFTGVGKTKGPMLGLQAISETTTFLGREAITLCHNRLTDGSFVHFLHAERPKLMESVPPDARVEVVYGDTDSLFFSWTDDLPMDLIFRLGNESGDFLTDEVRRVYVRHTDPNNPFKVEHEKSGWGLYIRKKMYAMVKFEKVSECEKWEYEGYYSDKSLMIRGLRPTRRDTFGLLRSKGKQILKEMLGWIPFDPALGRSRAEHRRWVIEQNVTKVMGTLGEVINVILDSHTLDREKRLANAALFKQTGELRASYSAEAAVAPHMAVGWKFHYDHGSRVPFLLCTEADVERLKRPDGLHRPTATLPKYNLSSTYGPSGYNSKDFYKPYKSLYGKSAYARHPDLEYLAEDSKLQINRSHYLQLFSQLVNIIFVPGIPGAETVPSLFAAARGRIHRETIGNRSIDDWVTAQPKKSFPRIFAQRK